MTDFDAAAPRRDFDLMEGDDYVFSISRDQADGSAYDISGWTFWLTIKEARDDPDSAAAVQKTVTNHTDASAGETEFVLTNSDTDGLQHRYWYDMQHKDGNGNIRTFMQGRFHFEPDSTESTS